jgi:two-component system, LytTR family, sensor kinase
MNSIIQKPKFKFITLIGLLILSVCHVLWLSKTGIGIIENIIFTLIFIICLLISFLIIGNNLSYFRPQNLNHSYFLIIWALFFASFSTFLPHYFFTFCYPKLVDIINYLHDTQYIKFAFVVLILICYIGICMLWYTFEDFKENQIYNQETLKLNNEAELSKLRQQLQPHFLFNSLNSINALIGSRPTEARKMIQQLSDFLRFTIKKDDNQMVDLAEEILHLELYLEIEKVRFGHRLITNFNVSDQCKTMKIPALLLQPIVENAIKFGLYDTIDSVEIEIIGKKMENLLQIEIRNPFDAETSINKKGTGFGLSSVRKRLQLLFQRSDLLKTSQTNNIFTTFITIPQPV